MFLAAMLWAAMSASDPAAATSPYAGTWLLNKEASRNVSGDRAPRVVVTVDKKRLRVEYLKEAAAPSTAEYNLDGSVNRKKEDRGGLMELRTENTLRVGADGTSLEMTTRFEAIGKSRGNTTVTIDTPPSTSTEIWEIVDEGKRLRMTPRGAGQPILIYDRQ